MIGYEFPLAVTYGMGWLEQWLHRFEPLLDPPLTGTILRALLMLALATVGVYLMLPRGQMPGTRLSRYLGAVLATLALVLLATIPVSTVSAGTGGQKNTFLWALADQPDVTCYTFHFLAAISLASAVLMITSRNPVYSALWFALVLLSNSGLYLLQKAEFLSAATIIIYAGAIVVTFLFVIMLAQPTGTARYDRHSREPWLASVTGLIMASALVGTLHHSARVEVGTTVKNATLRPDAVMVGRLLETQGDRHRIDSDRHVAGLGKTLFLDHVASVEVIGVLLLAAVVGAMLIAGQSTASTATQHQGPKK